MQAELKPGGTFLLTCQRSCEVSALNSSSLHLSLPLRILGISAFAVLAVYRLMVLLVSLPPYRLPPENRFLLRFFISEPKLLALHIAEAAATITATRLRFSG